MITFSLFNLTHLFFIYLIVINLITIFVFSFDKSRSKTDGKRISEKTLLLLAFIGGSPAALYAMNTFRHKTKKYSFQLPLYLIILLQIALIVWLLQRFSIV